MAIHVRCAACAAEYNVADRLAGKKIRCTKCQAVVSVPGDVNTAADSPQAEHPPADAVRTAPTSRQATAAAPSPRPSRRDRDREDDDDDAPPLKKKSSSMPLLLILGGVGLLVLLPVACCGVGAMFFWLTPVTVTTSGGPSSVAVTSVPATIDKPVPVADKDRPGDGNPVPVQPSKDPPLDKPKDQAPDRPKDQAPVKPNDPPPPQAVPWQAQADPLPAGLTLADKPQGVIPINGYPVLPNTIVDEIVYPTSPSPFVSVAVKGPTVNAQEVWDLRTMQRVGVATPKDPYSFPALSPDGAYVAVPMFGLNPDKGLDVFGVADGHDYPVEVTKESIFIDNFDFAGPGQVLTLRQVASPDGQAVRVQIWDVKTGAEVRQFTASAHHDGKHRAFSPGRRYIALAGMKGDRILVYDLGSAQLVGEAVLPALGICQGLAFAPDGKSFAGLFKMGGAMRLLAWDLATGKPTADHALDKAPVPNVAAFHGPAIDWLPDGGGWLLYGQALVDDKRGVIYWRIPVEGAYGGAPRRIFGDGKLAYVKSEKGKKTLVFEALPMDQITAALKTARGER